LLLAKRELRLRERKLRLRERELRFDLPRRGDFFVLAVLENAEAGGNRYAV
jgi:hypothetical protein